MWNFYDNEEFEIKDGYYISESKIIGKNIFIDRTSDLGKYFEKIFFEKGEKGLRKYLGAGDDTLISIEKRGLSVYKEDQNAKNIPGTMYLFGRYYKFMKNATLIENGSSDPRIWYAEKSENIEFRIDGLYAHNVGRELMSLLQNGQAAEAIKKYIEPKEQLFVELSRTWGYRVQGIMKYVDREKEFESNIWIDTRNGKMSILQVPFIEGVYNVKIYPGEKPVNMSVMSISDLPKSVEKKLVFGPGAHRKGKINPVKVIGRNNQTAIMKFDGYEVVLYPKKFEVVLPITRKHFMYSEWEIITEVLKNGPEAALLL